MTFTMWPSICIMFYNMFHCFLWQLELLYHQEKYTMYRSIINGHFGQITIPWTSDRHLTSRSQFTISYSLWAKLIDHSDRLCLTDTRFDRYSKIPIIPSVHYPVCYSLLLSLCVYNYRYIWSSGESETGLSSTIYIIK